MGKEGTWNYMRENEGEKEAMTTGGEEETSCREEKSRCNREGKRPKEALTEPPTPIFLNTPGWSLLAVN